MNECRRDDFFIKFFYFFPIFIIKILLRKFQVLINQFYSYYSKISQENRNYYHTRTL